jgi:hypothetical protein
MVQCVCDRLAQRARSRSGESARRHQRNARQPGHERRLYGARRKVSPAFLPIIHVDAEVLRIRKSGYIEAYRHLSAHFVASGRIPAAMEEGTWLSPVSVALQ